LNDDLTINLDDIQQLNKAREKVRLSLQASADWRKEAREDYQFVQGKQWTESDIETMKKQKRPTITINRCRPMINIVSGYATQNAFEPDFLPRGAGDDDICRVAKGVNKYVYDRCDFKRHKKKVFRDKLICGKGYYWVYYDFDYDRMDGSIKIERRSPFEVFVDPESVKEDLSDAEFCGVFSWEHPDELSQVYPEYKNEIARLAHQYDAEEVAADTVAGEPVWYSKQLKKLRVVQYWCKERSQRNVYEVGRGQIIGEDEAGAEIVAMAKLGLIKKHRIPSVTIRFMTFVDNILLESNDSPYKHKRFPLVQEFAYYTGEKDDNDSTLEPAGLIRDLKDVQREKNKQRSQRMHIVNTQANGIWLIYGTSTKQFDAELKKFGTTPGAKLNVPSGVTKIERITPDGVSAANVEMERATDDDFYAISGINPETLGNDMPNSMSGRAIELRQKSASVQIADLFDEAQNSEKLILDLLWGEKGRPGLIPQYFNEEMVIRIVGDNGEHSFVQLSTGLDKPMVQQAAVDPITGQPQLDEQGQLVQRVLYDLSLFEFDIVINESPATPTARLGNLYQLLDAQKSGIPVPPDVLLEFMDFPGKSEIKKRMQQQAQGGKMEPPKVSLTAKINELPMEVQEQIYAAEGIQVSPQSMIAQNMANNTPNTRVVQPPTQNGGII
jgi:hypothetical protein